MHNYPHEVTALEVINRSQSQVQQVRPESQRCWSYDNDQSWSWPQYGCIENNACGGRRQSPVNIETFHVIHDVAMKPLRFRGHTVPLHNFTLDNDGLTLSLRASPADKTKRTVSGGPLPGTFVFHHALFHWGSGPGHGSEHRIDGVAYPMESQLVYTNQKYAAANATTKEDGLAIIATLYRLTFVNFDSVKTVRGILAALEGNATRARRRLLPWMVRRVVSRRGSSDANAPLPPRLDKLMPPVARHEFFTYRGSLTTPPCTESVRWTVFHRPAFVSEAVLTGFRRLQGRPGRGPLVDNFRPPQKLYGRKIVSSFPPF